VTTFTRHLPSIEATAALARAVALLLRPGDVAAISGPLGAGKTTFIRALAVALGAPAAQVSSPTFVMVNRYALAGNGPLGQLTHVDAYRLTSTDDLDVLGWDRFFDPATRAAAAGTAAVIEWPERIAAALPPRERLLNIELAPDGTDSRSAAVTIPDSWASRPEFAMLAEREPTKCRVTGRWVAPTDASYPFADSRARMADLHGWLSGKHSTSRPAEAGDEP